MILAIDVGNTRIKTAVFEENTLVEVVFLEKKELIATIKIILKNHESITDIVVSSVGSANKILFLDLNKLVKVHFISSEMQFPFSNSYATPKTLGVDRMVLAAGAVLLYLGQNRLVIDAGTCITYDFIDAADTYYGGAISPGIRLRYKALHRFTENLPLLTSKNSDPLLIGNSTETSIHSGVINGVIFEIEGFIKEYTTKYPNIIIIFTGGDAEFLAKRLKNTIFANSNFLLESLNQTLQYFIKND